MAILNFLAALALLSWGTHQMQRGFRALVPARMLALPPPGSRGRAAAFFVLPNLGAAVTMPALAAAPAWSFHAFAIAGAVATLLTRRARVRGAGCALFGAGLVLLALRLLALPPADGAPAPLSAALAQALAQDALLSATAGALLVLVLRSTFLAILVIAVTWVAWLSPATAVALLLGAQVGAAALACAAAHGDAAMHRLACGGLLVASVVAASGLLLHAHLARPLAGAAPTALLWLHLALQALAAAVFVGLSTPLLRAMERWLPGTGEPRPVAARLRARDLDTPSLALSSALREVLRLADLVDRMLRSARDVFLHGDAVAAEAVRDAERHVNVSYRALKQYLAQVPRRPLLPEDQRRWEELLAFLIAAEQVGDRLDRIVADLEARWAPGPRIYPAAGQADVVALHGQLAQNLRLAASVCLERGLDAARELAAAKEAFRRMEQAFRSAHVARLVAGDAAAAAASSLHLNLLADFVDMNDQLCGFARSFLELRASPARAMQSPEVLA